MLIRVHADEDDGTVRVDAEMPRWTAENVVSPLELGLLVLEKLVHDLGARVTEVDVQSTTEAAFTVELPG